MSCPLEEVSYAMELLKPGGLFVLEVPSAKSFSVATDMFFKDSVVRQTIPVFHLMLFSEKTLLIMADKFGLKPEAMWFFGLDYYNFLIHLIARIPEFAKSDACEKMLDLNSDMQNVIDNKEMSDNILFVARKTK